MDPCVIHKFAPTIHQWSKHTLIRTTFQNITVLPSCVSTGRKTPWPLPPAPGVPTKIVAPLNLEVVLIVQQVLVRVALLP